MVVSRIFNHIITKMARTKTRTRRLWILISLYFQSFFLWDFDDVKMLKHVGNFLYN